MELKKLTEKTGNLAKQVGQFIQTEAQLFNPNTIEEKSFNQLVSYVDKKAEEMLVNGLRELLPEAGFLTEENTVTTEQKEYMWVIDPLDGTTNFIHQIPIYSISIALLKNDKPVIGVVFEPNRFELFYGWKEGGAYLNGRKIQVNQQANLSHTLLATGFPYYDFELMQAYMATLQQFLRKTRGMRRMGSAAVDLAYVACGRFDGFFEYGLSPWDVAAGVLLVEEAGGITSTFNDNRNPIFAKEIVATSSAIYPTFIDVIHEGFEALTDKRKRSEAEQ